MHIPNTQRPARCFVQSPYVHGTGKREEQLYLHALYGARGLPTISPVGALGTALLLMLI